MCALLALSFCAAGVQAQESSVQRRPSVPTEELPSARLEDKYPAQQQRRALPDPPSMRYSELKKSAPAQIVLPRLDTKPYIDEDERQIRNGERRIRGGVVRPVKISPERDGEWIDVEPGTRVWRLEIVSPEARGLRLHLANVALASGSQLYLYDGVASNSPDVYESPNVPQSKEIFSSPTTAETITVELVQKGDPGSSGDTLEIIGVGHLYRGKSDSSVIVPAGACNLDASCYPDWGHVGDSVGRTNYISGQYVYYCSGALINNSSGDFSPLFLTAAHCGIDSTTAASINVLWKYKTFSCNGPENYGPSSTGARFLATSPVSDSTLLEITGSLPDGLTWAGWSLQAPPVGGAITGIHHPETSYRRISFGNTVLDDPNHQDFHSVRFSSGTVEPGSSGSPLFNDKQEIIGQLYGGNAGCSTPNGASYYGKLATSYAQFKDASGNNYLESGLGDDRFGDISSREKAATVQPGTFNDLILRIGHDDWFKLSVPQFNQINIFLIQTSQWGAIKAEIYRNAETSPVFQAQLFTGGGDAYGIQGNDGDIYYLRLYLAPGATRVKYSFNFDLRPPAAPFVYANVPYYIKLSDIVFAGSVYTNGSADSTWFEWTTDPSFASFNSTPTRSIPAQPFFASVSYTPPHLPEDTTYYFRVVAFNGVQTVRSATVSFHTFTGQLSVAPGINMPFPDQRTGTMSPVQTVTLTNTGTLGLTLNVGNLSSPFSSSNNCPAVLASGSSCQVSITFSPAAAQQYWGNLFVNSSGGNSSLTFSGIGLGSIATVEIQNGGSYLGFPNTLVGTKAAPRMIKLTNTGQYAMDLSHVQLTAPFVQTSNCASTLDPGMSCIFQLSIFGNQPGFYAGTLKFSTEAGGQSTLFTNGYIFDINLTLTRPSRRQRGSVADVISPGQSAAYRVTLNPVGSANIPVAMNCSGAPAGVSCEVQPSMITTGGGPVDVNVIVGVAGSPVRQSRSLRLRNASLKNAQSKSFNLNVTATIGAATRIVEIPVTLTTTR